MSRIAHFSGLTEILRLLRCSKNLHWRVAAPQSVWRDELIAGTLVDYLWDLDSEACLAKDGESIWDWRSLAKALSEPHILYTALGHALNVMLSRQHSDRKINIENLTILERRSLEFSRSKSGERFADAPLGLQNRCRIVRIVNDVELMDEIEAEEPLVDVCGAIVKKRHYGGLWGENTLV